MRVRGGAGRWDCDASLHAWRQFYDRSFPEVSSYAVRLTGGRAAVAEDLVHDAYLALVRACNDGRVDRLETGWLIVVVRQRFLNRVRDDQREERRLRLVHSAQPDSADPEVDLTGELLADLPDRSRAALVLRYVDDLPVAEVAQLLGLTVRATESLLVRARDQVRRRHGEARHG